MNDRLIKALNTSPPSIFSTPTKQNVISTPSTPTSSSKTPRISSIHKRKSKEEPLETPPSPKQAKQQQPQAINYFLTLKLFLAIIAIIIAALIVFFLAKELKIFLNQKMQERAVSYVKFNTLKKLKEQKGNFECGYTSTPSLPRHIVIELLEQQDVSLLKDDNVVAYGEDVEYVGKEPIIPFKCSFYNFIMDILQEYGNALLLSLPVSCTLFYFYYKIKTNRRNSKLTNEMFSEVIDILKKEYRNKEHRYDGYVAVEHIKRDVASTKEKDRLWSRVESMVLKDGRVLVTPQNFHGSQMITWKWNSTVG